MTLSQPTRAVITGASSGIGESFARLLAEKGVNLILVARRLERLEKLAQELRQKHKIEVECFPIDLSLPGSSTELFSYCTKNGIIVDMLINNAGVGLYEKFTLSDLKATQDLMQLNMFSLTELCHHFAKHMLNHRRPSYITNIASIAAYQGVPLFSVYAASKSYVRVFSELLNRELKGSNLSVTCVCPGGTATEFLKISGQAMKGKTGLLMNPTDVARMAIEGTFARKSIVIPGFLNKLICWYPRLLPSACSLTLASKVMDSTVDKIKSE